MSSRLFDAALVAALCFICGCSSNASTEADSGVDLDSPDSQSDEGVVDQRPVDVRADSAGDSDVVSYSWDPRLPSTEKLGTRRGLRIARGIIHAHSVNSHDACDGKPFIDGKPNEPCLEDLRFAICATRLDFLMLTEHDDHYAEVPFVDTLLARGNDALIKKNGQPVANAIDCADPTVDQPPLLLSGLELEETMPVGMERHPDMPADQLPAFYGSDDPANDAKLEQAGGVLLAAHTESKSLERLFAHDLVGVEVYNLHANLDPSIRKEIFGVDPLGYLLDAGPFGSSNPADPEPDLSFLAFFFESDNAIDKWHALLAKRPTAGTIGNDSHQNVMALKWRDGERMDSYRRTFRWFSNHVLVKSVSFDAIKQAVGRGRSYMVFEILGTPNNFDYHASAGGETFEMGDEVALSKKPTLSLRLPTVLALPEQIAAPAVTGRIIRIDADAQTTVVAEGGEDLSLQLDKAAVYRAEVHIVPHHLAPFLGSDPKRYIKKQIWIYSNPIYIK